MIFLREADSSGMALQLSSPQRPSAGTDSHRRADIRVTLGRESIPLLIAYRDAAAVRTAVRFINSIYVITKINGCIHIPVNDNPAAMRADPKPMFEFQSFIR
mgnify:FL=1